MPCMESIAANVNECFQRHRVAGARVCVALSGGVDSVVLLHAAADLRAAFDLKLSACHVHHGLSPNANDWVRFCNKLCQSLDIPLDVARVKVDRAAGIGLEAAARETRYAALLQQDAAFFLLAQHQDDQAETVLHQLLRGTGLNGLAGMGEMRVLADGKTLLRPLLGVRRSMIEAYAVAQNLSWVEDESNLDTTLTRNFLRHEILPKIATRFPQYNESLSRMAQHAVECNIMLEDLAAIDLAWHEGVAHAEVLDRLPMPRQVNALYHWLRWQIASPPSREQLEEWARQLFRAAPDSRPHLAGGHDFLIRRRKNVLSLEKIGKH